MAETRLFKDKQQLIREGLAKRECYEACPGVACPNPRRALSNKITRHARFGDFYNVHDRINATYGPYGPPGPLAVLNPDVGPGPIIYPGEYYDPRANLDIDNYEYSTRNPFRRTYAHQYRDPLHHTRTVIHDPEGIPVLAAPIAAPPPVLPIATQPFPPPLPAMTSDGMATKCFNDAAIIGNDLCATIKPSTCAAALDFPPHPDQRLLDHRPSMTSTTT